MSSNIGELIRLAPTTSSKYGGIWPGDTNLPCWRLLCTRVGAGWIGAPPEGGRRGVVVKERIRGDRRTKNRFEMVGTLPATLETWHRHKVRNLSPGGALVESTIPLPPGSRLTGRLSFQGSHRDVKAEVRYTQEEGSRVGSGEVFDRVGVGRRHGPHGGCLDAGRAAAARHSQRRKNGGSGRGCRPPTAPR